MAYGQLGLHPWELLRYTPGQIKAALKGFSEGKKAERHLVAWAVANLMNATGNFKKPVTIESLTGEKSQKQEKTGAQLKAEAAEIKRRLEGKLKRDGKR